MALIKSFVDFFIPPICEGCGLLLEKSETRLCRSCLYQMEPLLIAGRCKSCFKSIEFTCPACADLASPLDKFGAVWPYMGAPMKLIKRYKREKRELDIPLFASYLLLQFDRLSWPLPDLIATPPQDPIKQFWKRFDPMGDIAEEFAHLLKVPLFKGIKRLAGRPSQGSLIKKERLTLTEEDFILFDSASARGKKVLVIDDVYTTGATLKGLANAIWRASPLAIYGLVLAWVEAEGEQGKKRS